MLSSRLTRLLHAKIMPSHLPWNGVKLLLLAVAEGLACLDDDGCERQSNRRDGELWANLGCVGIVMVGVSKMSLQAIVWALSLHIESRDNVYMERDASDGEEAMVRGDTILMLNRHSVGG
jgi:hypothetical protein